LNKLSLAKRLNCCMCHY